MEMPYQLDILWYRTFQSVLKIGNYFEDIAQMITWAKKEAIPLYPVPTVWGRKDFRRLIESI